MRSRLDVRDLITVGVLAAVALVISVIVGVASATTVIGAFFYTAVAAFFVSIVFLLAAVRIRKTGTLFLMGTIVSLPGLTTGNIVGVAACAVGWLLADVIAGHYTHRARIVVAYVAGSTFQFTGYTLPLFLSAGEHLTTRNGTYRLSDEAIQEYLSYVTWPVFVGATLLTAVLSAAGALLSARVIRKHFRKAGLVR
ncbi:MptD family putative ECF transporter S component [Micromonospora craniellae]|uniref:MptD family putative ECF transporter S component n=1 Tax=Micromonospora craniellae TaxID=2294034 RepID=UPI001313FB1B|nr:MptD family putative ECF transporter S component [Micromonospora craniellae]